MKNPGQKDPKPHQSKPSDTRRLGNLPLSCMHEGAPEVKVAPMVLASALWPYEAEMVANFAHLLVQCRSAISLPLVCTCCHVHGLSATGLIEAFLNRSCVCMEMGSETELPLVGLTTCTCIL